MRPGRILLVRLLNGFDPFNPISRLRGPIRHHYTMIIYANHQLMTGPPSPSMAESRISASCLVGNLFTLGSYQFLLEEDQQRSGADYQADVESFSAHPIATLLECVPDEVREQETRYHRSLSRAQSFAIDGDRLTLTTPGGEVLIFVLDEKWSWVRSLAGRQFPARSHIATRSGRPGSTGGASQVFLNRVFERLQSCGRINP